MESDRGTGRTTRQMANAPTGSIFVWCNDVLRYPRALAKALNRSDLRIIGPSELTGYVPQRFAGLDIPSVVLDHAADLTKAQWEGLWALRPYVGRSKPHTEGGE